ncbi:hypothetical protein KUCAC02_019072, partial [Chaenocephalus aceratus]
ISRCLKPGGRFVSVTFANPLFRKRLYARTEYTGEGLSPRRCSSGEEDTGGHTKAPPPMIATQSEDEEDFLSNIDLT